MHLGYLVCVRLCTVVMTWEKGVDVLASAFY